MLHSASCEVHLDEAPARGYWTNGDEVTGFVLLEAKREVHIASIEAQLRCEDRGRAYVRESEELVDMSAAHVDTFEVLWKTEPIKFVLPHESGDLPKGEYRFRFQFRLPEDARELPSSFNAEPSHDFNGTFWGVYAVIDRDTRLRSNYRAFGEIRMLPLRQRVFSGDDGSFRAVTNATSLRLHRRPSFLLSDNEKNTVEVEGRLGVPEGGLKQSREHAEKDDAELPEIRVAVRCGDAGAAIVKEIVVFMDTTYLTLVHGTQSRSQTNAIVITNECNVVITGDGWQDLSSLIAPARIYGLPETWTSNIHDIKHTLRVQFILALASRPTRTQILELTTPVTLHSEAATTSLEHPPPPPYIHEGETSKPT